MRSKARTVENAISDLEHILQRSPTDDELAAKLKIKSSDLEKWLTEISSCTVGPLDHVVADNTPASTHGGASFVPSPDSVVEAQELRKIMRHEIKRLPERERTVLALYYEENLTLDEIGEVLGITESRVSQIHTKAVLQLRWRLTAAEVA